jgi:hypothetical protein
MEATVVADMSAVKPKKKGEGDSGTRFADLTKSGASPFHRVTANAICD